MAFRSPQGYGATRYGQRHICECRPAATQRRTWTGKPRCGKAQGQLVEPIGSMYGIYANIWGILMVNVTIYSMDPMGKVIKMNK